MSAERWAPIPGSPAYQASTEGRIRRVATGRVLRDHSNGRKGYRKLQLGRGRHEYVHVLVLEAFVGPRPDGHEGHHKNDRQGDNRLANLEWITSEKNRWLQWNKDGQHGPEPMTDEEYATMLAENGWI